MLILTRKTGEEIRIGDRISLKIIEIRGNQVRVGIDAPKDVAVHRKEIYALIQDHNRAAAKSTPLDPGVLSSIWAGQKKEGISIGS